MMNMSKILNYVCAVLALVIVVMTFLPYWNFGAAELEKELPEISAAAAAYAEAKEKEPEMKAAAAAADAASKEAASIAKDAKSAANEATEAVEALVEAGAAEAEIAAAQAIADEAAAEAEAAAEVAAEAKAAATAANEANKLPKEVAPITDISTSIEGYVWFPADLDYLNSYFTALDAGFSINILAFSVAALLILCLVCMYMCVVSAAKALIAILPIVTGAVGLLAYQLAPALKLGAGSLPTVIQVLSGVLAGVGVIALVVGLIVSKKAAEE